MRAVMHWFRSIAIVGGLSALPCGQAAPSLVFQGTGAQPSSVAAAEEAATHDRNGLLAMVLAAMGMVALAAARAPTLARPVTEPSGGEPARH